MELRHLRYLVAVVDEGGFTRAAEALHVAQPGISSQLRQLERELGQPLLDRSGGSVTLTAAGEAVLPYARAALAAAAGVREAIDELTGLMTGQLAIGTVASFSSPAFGLPRLIADFHLDHPGIDLTLTESPTDPLLDALRSGRVDVAFLGLRTVPPHGLSTEVLWTDEVVAAGPGLPERITVAGLADRAVYTFPTWTSIRIAFDEACERAAFHPRVAFETTAPPILVDLAARADGVAVLPSSAVPGHTSFDPPLYSRVAMAWRSDVPVSPAARAFLAHTRKAAGI
ncbi:LysR family transcriptional regulator [Actinocorallia longicatena]|uniref:LysR substrate-binding domain-containing protein n=1 Tax=Actinocorallia longicatena TaxID=111803 RepID=A0ABP6QJW9_9ACTN